MCDDVLRTESARPTASHADGEPLHRTTFRTRTSFSLNDRTSFQRRGLRRSPAVRVPRRRQCSAPLGARARPDESKRNPSRGRNKRGALDSERSATSQHPGARTCGRARPKNRCGRRLLGPSSIGRTTGGHRLDTRDPRGGRVVPGWRDRNPPLDSERLRAPHPASVDHGGPGYGVGRAREPRCPTSAIFTMTTYGLRATRKP